MNPVHLIIATAIIVVAIALASWLLHKKIDSGFKWLASDVRYTSIHISDEVINIKAHAREMADQVASVVMTPILHTKEDIEKLHTAVIVSRGHAEERFSSVAEDVREHASRAVHEAIGTVRGVKHETCQICGKVANIWKIVDGKIECADCSIRKLVS